MSVYVQPYFCKKSFEIQKKSFPDSSSSSLVETLMVRTKIQIQASIHFWQNHLYQNLTKISINAKIWYHITFFLKYLN